MVKKVLMVCLGNICRSPIAEAVFQQLVKEKHLEGSWMVDSAAIGPWHIGKLPDKRARKVLEDFKVEYSIENKARQINPEDFYKFDYIFGMDEDNISDLERIKPGGSKAAILLLGDFDPQGERIIRDPYYDNGSAGFVRCYEQCLRCCAEFLRKKHTGDM